MGKNNITHHTTQRSKTLMRRSVQKPGTSLKRHLKVQVHTGTLVEQPSVEAVSKISPKLSLGNLDPKRASRASKIKKSNLIQHFNPDQPAYAIPVTITKVTAEPVSLPVTSLEPTAPTPDFLEQAIHNATSHLEPAPKQRHKRRLHLRRKHVHA